MKRILLIVLLVASAIAFQTVAFAETEIDGFRGIKWGTDISKMKEFTKVGVDPSFGGIDKYTKSGDSMSIGAASLDSIQYGCWHGKFSSVSIKTSGYSNFHALLDTSKEKFGAPFQANKYIEKYFWPNSGTALMLDYNKFSQVGSLFMGSKAISVEQTEFSRAKAREGANKGF